MAEIKAFRGLRYTKKAGDIGKLCCPPYDIISAQQRNDYIEENQHNIIRLELPKSPDTPEDDKAYATAGELVEKWVGEGVLADDSAPCLYVYEMSFELGGSMRRVKGFVSLVKLEEFSKGIVLPHEETLSKAKTDRFNLMCSTKCNFSQIYSLYMDKKGSVYDLIETASISSPTSEFTDNEGVTHKLWAVSDTAAIDEISELMREKKIYIADGHHRYETALNYRNHLKEQGGDIGTAAYVPMMLVNMENEGLVVFPTHRIVRDLSTYNYNDVIEKCEKYFSLTKFLNREKAEIALNAAYTEGKKAFVMYTGDNNYTLLTLTDESIMKEFMPEASDALAGLDVSVLHTLVLERIFGIDKENMAKQINLTYTKISDAAIAEVDGGRANCSFLLNPTRVQEIRDVALAGEKMPQKSTYFYPKLTTGLVMNRIIKDIV